MKTDNIDYIINACLYGPAESLAPLFTRAFEESRRKFSNKIAFHMPGMVHYETEFYEATDPLRFPSLSITGPQCSLNCEHCNAHLLETMIPTTTPEKLWETLLEIDRAGGKGCLISGGSTPKGNTPLMKYIPTLKRAKKELDLDIVVHTGVVYPEIASALASVGIDGAMLDIIGSEETLKDIYHLDMSVDVFEESLTLLEENGIPIMPHIVVGLHYGQLKGEDEAIRMISRHKSDSVIVVAFKPLDGTPMESTTPASPLDIARVILASRLAMPDRPTILGCARPHGEHRRETDRLAIDAGVSAIAYPTEAGYNYALERGLNIIMSEECCSLLDRALTDN